MDAYRYTAMRDEMQKIALTPRHAAAKTLGGLVSRGAGAQAAVRAADKIELASRGSRKSALSLLQQYAKKYPKVKTAASDELQKIALGIRPISRLYSRFAKREIAQSRAAGLLRKGTEFGREYGRPRQAIRARAARTMGQVAAGAPKQERIKFLKSPEGRGVIQEARGALGMKPTRFKSSSVKIALGPLALFAGGALARSLAGGVARKFLGKAVKGMGRKSMIGSRLGKAHKALGRKGVQKWTRRGGTTAEYGSMLMPAGGKAQPSSVSMVSQPY